MKYLFTLLVSILSLTTGFSQVIWEVYGAGGNSGATWRHDIVILQGTASASLSGYSLQYASSTGTTWNKLDLTGSFDANGFYYIQLASGGASGSSTYPFTISQTGATNIATANGKLALVNGTTTLSGGCPLASTVDFVGYGTANCFEGTAPAPAPSATTCIKRNTDTNDNAADFSTFAATALPIVLKDFTAQAHAGSVTVAFTTALERNNSHFEIERSANAITYEVIGTVESKGNASEPQHYTFEDRTPFKGTNYYRLRQVDTDGQSTLSAVRSVAFGTAKTVSVFPTPATDNLNIQLEEAFDSDANWQIVDMVGKVVSEGTIPAEQKNYTVPVQALVPGNYALRVTCKQATSVKQFSKN